MQSKLPLLPSGPGGVRKSAIRRPWQNQCAAKSFFVQTKRCGGQDGDVRLFGLDDLEAF